MVQLLDKTFTTNAREIEYIKEKLERKDHSQYVYRMWPVVVISLSFSVLATFIL